MGEGYLSVAEDVVNLGRLVPPRRRRPACSIAEGANVGALAVLGDGVQVAPGARIERAVVLQGAEIGEGALLRDCIVAPGRASARAPR
jgi:NDP-sugar pyrophosphorylase family protein